MWGICWGSGHKRGRGEIQVINLLMRVRLCVVQKGRGHLLFCGSLKRLWLHKSRSHMTRLPYCLHLICTLLAVQSESLESARLWSRGDWLAVEGLDIPLWLLPQVGTSPERKDLSGFCVSIPQLEHRGCGDTAQGLPSGWGWGGGLFWRPVPASLADSTGHTGQSPD